MLAIGSRFSGGGSPCNSGPGFFNGALLYASGTLETVFRLPNLLGNRNRSHGLSPTGLLIFSFYPLNVLFLYRESRSLMTVLFLF
jgi:hypothetical protein